MRLFLLQILGMNSIMVPFILHPLAAIADLKHGLFVSAVVYRTQYVVAIHSEQKKSILTFLQNTIPVHFVLTETTS